MTNRSASLLRLALCVAVLTACPWTRAAQARQAAFPVRLLGGADPDARRRIIDDPLHDAHLEHWRELVAADGAIRLDPASASPRVTRTARGLAIASGSTLVRLLVLPAEARPQLYARLTPGQRPAAGTPVAGVRLLPIGRAMADLDVTRLRASSRVAAPLGTAELGAQLTALLAHGGDDGVAHTVTSHAVDGPIEVRATCDRRDTATLWAITLTGIDDPLQVERVWLDCDAVRADAAVMILGVAPRVQARIAGDVRPALLLQPGESLAVDLPQLPATPTALSFGVVLDPLQRQAVEGAYAISWEHAGASIELTADRIARARASLPAFREQRVDWPATASATGSLRFVNIGATGLLIGQPILHGPVARTRPNLLLISIDTLRADHLGCYGYARDTSPFLDRLAADGVLFRDCSSAAPFTLPAHATLLTGLMPARHGAIDDASRIDARALAYLPRLLAADGYATAAFVGGGYLSEDFGFHPGFDRFVAADPIRPAQGVGIAKTLPPQTPSSLDGVAAWITERGDEPWFVLLHTYAAHDYFVPEEHFERFDRGGTGAWRQQLWRIPGPDLVTPETPPADDDLRYIEDLYDAGIHLVDAALERFITTLDERHQLDDTLLVITSDHGEEFLDHGRLGHGVTLYREMLHVPLLVRGPGIPPHRVDQPVHHADLLPTLLELLGTPVPDGLDGHSRLRELRSVQPLDDTLHTPLFAEVDTPRSRRATLRLGGFAVIRGETAGGVTFPAGSALELYDLSRDPGQRNNLAATDPLRTTRLAGTLDDLRRRLRAAAPAPTTVLLDDATRALLRQLGYLTGDGR